MYAVRWKTKPTQRDFKFWRVRLRISNRTLYRHWYHGVSFYRFEQLPTYTKRDVCRSRTDFSVKHSKTQRPVRPDHCGIDPGQTFCTATYGHRQWQTIILSGRRYVISLVCTERLWRRGLVLQVGRRGTLCDDVPLRFRAQSYPCSAAIIIVTRWRTKTNRRQGEYYAIRVATFGFLSYSARNVSGLENIRFTCRVWKGYKHWKNWKRVCFFDFRK